MRWMLIAAALVAAGPAAGQERAKVVERLYETMFELKIAGLICNDFVRGEPIEYSRQIDRYWSSIKGAKQSDPTAFVQETQAKIRTMHRDDARSLCINMLNTALEKYEAASKGSLEVTSRLGTIPPILTGRIW